MTVGLLAGAMGFERMRGIAMIQVMVAGPYAGAFDSDFTVLGATLATLAALLLWVIGTRRHWHAQEGREGSAPCDCPH